MQVTDRKARRFTLCIAAGLAAAAVAATGAQGGGGTKCTDPGLLGASGYRLACLSSRETPFLTEHTKGQYRVDVSSAPFLTEHTNGQYAGDRGLPQAAPARSVPFMTEHTHGQYTDDRGAPQALPSTFVQPGPSDGFDWADAAIGAGVALGLVLLVAGAVLASHRSRTRLASF